ncbi:hypothetical protein F5B19DRAFT_486997 [Rostrohypoxylon terebratum]|nr:hypothetical protein F5B19DRAFT_486997 [Rostrohypoxylon terebratum]
MATLSAYEDLGFPLLVEPQVPHNRHQDYLSNQTTENKAAVIGGAIVRDIHLLVGDVSSESDKSQVQFKDLPVLPFQVPESSSMSAQLKSSKLDPDSMPVFVFPEEYIAPPEFEKVEALSQDDVSFGQSNTTLLDLYTVSGDIDNFWNVKGLTAKLYKHKDTQLESATEKVILNAQSLAFKGKPLASLFPFIDSDDIKNLPIANLELSYSADKSDNPVHKPGLYLEVDIELEGNLQWVGDAMKTLFGSSGNTPTIHLTAWLSESRNWSKPPSNIEKLVLQGYFKNMEFKPWNILEFKTMGIELTVMKSEGSWNFGFGFIGEAMVTNIPEARLPVWLSYRIATDIDDDSSGMGVDAGRIWSLTVVANDWRNIFGYENIHMTEAMFSASFSESNFDSSVPLDVAGLIKIGDGPGQLVVHGQFAKGWKHAINWTWVQFQSHYGVPLVEKDHFIEAHLGDLTLSDIRRLYAQITGGQAMPEEHDSVSETITFRNMAIRASCTKYLGCEQDRKALEMLGEVTVGDMSSYSASLTFATDGITVIGGVSNVKVPGTSVTIEKAGLRFFMSLKKGKTSDTTNTSGSSLATRNSNSREKTSISVFGIVKYESVIFKAGLYLTKKNNKENDWLVFGSADRIRFREIWPSIEEDSFLNLELDNVAIIASSKDRKFPSHEHQSRRTGGTNVNHDEGSEQASWDVLSEIETHGYSVIKGFQVCATISAFEQLEQLNGGKKIDGLMVSLSVSPEGKIDVAIRLPKSFKLQLSAFAWFDDFDASVGIGSDGPQIQLSATLTVLMENSDPILVKGLVVGTLKGAAGELFMDPDSKWINPFGLNKELIVSKLGIGVGFDYATVLETGPRYKNIALLPPNTKRGDIVFSGLKLYLSSGAQFMGIDYPRGIQLRGKLTFFGKSGDFDGSFTDDGVVIKGGLDAFSVGGLEVTSLREYNGRKRTTLDVELTKERQRLFVDGVVRYHDLVLKILVDVDVQRRYLRGEIEIRLADSLSFKLDAGVQVGEQAINGGLDSAVWWFDGELKGGVVSAVRDGILQGITALETQAKHSIEKAEEEVNGRLKELRRDLEERKKVLDELQRESREEVTARQKKIAEENTTLRNMQDEIDKLNKRYREAKSKKNSNDAKIQEAKTKRDQAQERLDNKKREMRKEYDKKIQEQKDNQAHWESERKRLQDKKEASWGDVLRKAETADWSWRYWSDVETERWKWKNTCIWYLDNCHWWEIPYWTAKLTEATLGLEQAHASKVAEAEILHALKAITNSDAFKTVEREINNAAFEIGRFERALEKLVTQGPSAYIEEMVRDERRDLDRQIKLLSDLMDASKILEEELRKAKNALDKGQGRLSPKQEEARKHIAELESELKLKPFEEDYRNKKQDYDKIKSQADSLLVTLEDIKKGIHVGADIVRQVTKLVAKGLPDIKNIKGRVSSNALAKHEPLMFEITVSWMGQDHLCCVEWAPNQDAHELYNGAAKKVVAIVD